jgi:uncharacterized protein YndB with AHSA1/START domain
MSNTVRLHRVLRAAPENVYRAFLEPDAMVKWWQESLALLAQLVEPEIPG